MTLGPGAFDCFYTQKRWHIKKLFLQSMLCTRTSRCNFHSLYTIFRMQQSFTNRWSYVFTKHWGLQYSGYTGGCELIERPFLEFISTFKTYTKHAKTWFQANFCHEITQLVTWFLLPFQFYNQQTLILWCGKCRHVHCTQKLEAKLNAAFSTVRHKWRVADNWNLWPENPRSSRDCNMYGNVAR